MPTKIISIAAQKGKNELSKGQKLFNKLIKKIEQERQLLGDWQENISHCQKKYVEKYRPLWQSFDEQRVKMLCRLDVIYFDTALDKQDKAKLQHIIADLAAAIVRPDSDKEVKRIYNGYTDSDFDAVSGEGVEVVKRLFEEKFGVDLGEAFDRSSPKKMMAKLHAMMQEKIQGEASLAEENAQIKDAKKAMRNKSENALAKEAKQHESKQKISQSIREIFRKLASALHPDKEQDDTERKRKTALMQRVNIAYGNNDLLTLLELQLECEQIDAAMLGALSEDRLKCSNRDLI
ncbi:MAG: molecular chaperone DnaJ [Glaciimonas sp.]|nr:molecular chaperone DnaJ [Glaciimonas sp.]